MARCTDQCHIPREEPAGGSVSLTRSTAVGRRPELDGLIVSHRVKPMELGKLYTHVCNTVSAVCTLGALVYAKLAYDAGRAATGATRGSAVAGAHTLPHGAAINSNWWPAIALGALAIALLVVGPSRLLLARYRPKSRPTVTAAAASWNRVGINVSRVYVHTEHLTDELYIDFVITGFNGSADTIYLQYAECTIGYHSNSKSVFSAFVSLPPAQLIIDKEFRRALANGSQFQLKLSQRVPREVARQMSDRLMADDAVRLDVDRLSIIIARASDRDYRGKLPLCDYITVTGNHPGPAQMHVVMQVTASGSSAVTQ